MMILLCLTLLSTTLSQEEKIVKLPLMDSFDTYTIRLMPDSYPMKLILDLDFTIDYMWVFYNTYPIRSDKETVELNKKIGNNSMADRTYDNFEVVHSNIKLNNFPIHVLDDSNDMDNYFDGFPLAYSFTNNNNSIIEYLYSREMIEHKGFGISKVKGELPSYLFIGGFSDDVKKAFPYVSKCKIKNNQWGCQLDKVIINNHKEFYNTYDLVFQANHMEIYAPEEYNEYLYQDIIRHYVENKTCSYNKNKELYLCDCGIIYKFPTMHFIIEGINFTFVARELFSNYNKQCEFNIVSNKKNANQWEFGTIFLRKYVTYFDYDHSEILFYTKKQLIKQNKPIHSAVMFSCILFIIIGIIHLAYIRIIKVSTK